ncbi:MAG: hypothetical protein GXP59_08230, partial [Deltaproteobacteria bacterium]|nr:hypothetical protein [Deltaproteobacteria bacterium]
MRRISMVCGLIIACLFFACSGTQAMEAKLGTETITAGGTISVTGKIAPGKNLYVVISSAKMFSPGNALGPKEKKRLVNGKNGKNVFGNTSIPPNYYIITNVPDSLATPKVVWKGQTDGIFAFPPFKYKVKVNKIKKWADINPQIKGLLGPINSAAQWKFLAFTHEKK